MKISVILFLLVLSETVQANLINVLATDTGSMSSTNSINDDRLRAYVQGSFVVDGFMKFDLSSIDNNAKINSITLTTYHEFGFGNPFHDPQVRIYHVDDDTWSRGSSHPGLNRSITGIYSGFPSGNGVSFNWSLDLLAFDWAADLTDDILSLGMRTEKNGYNFVYWYGRDNPSYAPRLAIDYSAIADPTSVPEPTTIALLLLGLIGIIFSRKNLITFARYDQRQQA